MGAGSSFLYLHEEVGADFVGCDSQLEMTPFQRQVIEATKAEEARQKEEQREEMRQQAGGAASQGHTPQRNPRAQQGMGNNAETVRYVNRNELPDHPVHDS